MYFFCNSRINVITLYSGHVCVYYASMLRCWHLAWILVRTDHPCLGVGCHSRSVLRPSCGCDQSGRSPYAAPLRRGEAKAPPLRSASWGTPRQSPLSWPTMGMVSHCKLSPWRQCLSRPAWGRGSGHQSSWRWTRSSQGERFHRGRSHHTSGMHRRQRRWSHH
jgi:hypothetical protein